ncbi:hypothetical protein [Clostridium beijerinckii]|uniref:hypothetical protein n=1 Tax=Clostridium beijerinckii TaxID=1520 RepID=UPI0013615AC6|nr:hypothetical protein [Clostridium beijerinckii]MZK75819.1 hypothetical protein [Clostridium beijerinckii]MZK99962.1 hypothetical protein [Clostridium beijerinckii]MZL19674.1 hypothetical protein [Clostridium beijerinckii]MZL29640.1 hypothetical protein [Clostridium beijerinckii]
MAKRYKCTLQKENKEYVSRQLDYDTGLLIKNTIKTRYILTNTTVNEKAKNLYIYS